MAEIQIYADSEQTVKVFCSADSNKALGVKNGKPAFVDIDYTDEAQEWLKVESGNTTIKGFVLVNKAIRKAISQPSVVGQELVFVDYVISCFNGTSLWSLSGDVEFGCICVANDTTLVWEASEAIKLVVKTSTVTSSQLWKISPQFGSVCCKAYSDRALSIKEDGNLKLVLADSSDKTQQWVKIFKRNDQAFALLNIATSKVCVQPSGLGQKVGSVKYKGHLKTEFLWKECGDNNEFRNISVESDAGRIWDEDKSTQSIPIVVQKVSGNESQLWKITPQIVTVCCKAFSDKALGVENGKLKFLCPKSGDKNQQWLKILSKDPLAFALVNKATWMALRNPSAAGEEAVLVAYKNNPDQNLLWSESDDKEEGYKTINIANKTTLSLEANQISQDVKVVAQTSNASKTGQLWKFRLCT